MSSSREKRIVTRIAQMMMFQELARPRDPFDRNAQRAWWEPMPPDIKEHWRARASEIVEEVMRLHAA